MFHRSVLLLYICAGICIGVVIGSLLAVPQVVGVVAVAAGMAGAAFIRGHATLLLVCMVGIGLGTLRTSFMPSFEENPYDRRAEFTGEVVREPELLLDAQRLAVRSTSLDGLVQVKAALHPRFRIGDRLNMACTLRKPEPFDGFRYDRYLERHHIAATCSYPTIQLAGRRESLTTKLFDTKERLKDGLRHVLPAPEHTILLGALFGDKRAVPEQIMNAFRTTGTSHVLVISGLHVSLLTMIIMHILRAAGLRKQHTVVMIMAFLVLYLVFTGVQASATRATLFGSTALIAELLGRRSQSLRVLLVVATVMLLVNPLLLVYDTGFQLSFAATAGIIVASSWIQERLWWMPSALGLRAAMATSLSAIVATAPIIAYAFQTLSLSAFVANLVVVPTMPLVMFGGIIVTAVSQLSQTMASVIAVPLYFVIHALIQIIEWFASLPYTSLSLPNMHIGLFFALLVHMVLVGWYVTVHKKQPA